MLQSFLIWICFMFIKKSIFYTRRSSSNVFVHTSTVRKNVPVQWKAIHLQLIGFVEPILFQLPYQKHIVKLFPSYLCFRSNHLDQLNEHCTDVEYKKPNQSPFTFHLDYSFVLVFELRLPSLYHQYFRLVWYLLIQDYFHSPSNVFWRIRKCPTDIIVEILRS